MLFATLTGLYGRNKAAIRFQQVQNQRKERKRRKNRKNKKNFFSKEERLEHQKTSFNTPTAAQAAVANKSHNLDGRQIDAKMAVPRGESREQTRGAATAAPPVSKKLFLGGLSPDSTEASLRAFFGKFGEITELKVMLDQATGRPRGFGFVTYETDEAAEKAIGKEHEIDGRVVEAKYAEARRQYERPPAGKGGYGGGGGYGGKGGYQQQYGGGYGGGGYGGKGGYQQQQYGGGGYGGGGYGGKGGYQQQGGYPQQQQQQPYGGGGYGYGGGGGQIVSYGQQGQQAQQMGGGASYGTAPSYGASQAGGPQRSNHGGGSNQGHPYSRS